MYGAMLLAPEGHLHTKYLLVLKYYIALRTQFLILGPKCCCPLLRSFTLPLLIKISDARNSTKAQRHSTFKRQSHDLSIATRFISACLYLLIKQYHQCSLNT